MATYQNRESFIPYSRQDLIELCLADSHFDRLEKDKFREFCEILTAYYHFKFHHLSEKLKASFSLFNPDGEMGNLKPQKSSLSEEFIHQQKIQLLTDFRHILAQANYSEVSQSSLDKAFKEKTLLELDTIVDFGEFEEVVCYYRGTGTKTINKKIWFGLKKVKQTIDVLQRVVLLIKFKNSEHFQDKEKQKLKFNPGKFYIYLYRNIPKYDLDFLFPNVSIRMTFKDRLILIASAIGAAIPMFIKVLPRLLLIIAIISFLTTGNVPFQDVNITKDDVNNMMPILVTSMSLLITFGGFAVKQYLSYKSKQIKFQKDVTETLFFRQLAINLGVFQSLIDEAEEEECKEIILVYYHLLSSPKPLTMEEIDDRIENWMEQKFACQIDFDINNTIDSLMTIKGQIIKNKSHHKQPNLERQEQSLVTRTQDGYCQALSLEQAKEVIDYTWDHLFDYASDSSEFSRV